MARVGLLFESLRDPRRTFNDCSDAASNHKSGRYYVDDAKNERNIDHDDSGVKGFET